MLFRTLTPTNWTGLPKINSRTTAAAITKRPTSDTCLSQPLTVSNIFIYTPRTLVHHVT
ncbi:MAG: hypothetical protein HVK41_04115 [Pelagibacteraceae bacterium]|nr:hypothetical protein [Pelagibacteraceae bacterium]MBO6470187.1 hypothetical protein [Pelagibacteraceae bacterium]MBO6470831.1 hypothetical protein [Pelagibacteraceae bacterium]MBO6478805.1 hypothetical protein [Pelagibacteraceae bacterium]